MRGFTYLRILLTITSDEVDAPQVLESLRDNFHGRLLVASDEVSERDSKNTDSLSVSIFHVLDDLESCD